MNMNDALNIKIDQLLALSYELEGLLALARTRGETTPSEVWKMLSEKAAVIHDSIDMFAADFTKKNSDVDLAVAPPVESVAAVAATADVAETADMTETADAVPDSPLPPVQDESPIADETVFYSGDVDADDEPAVDDDTLNDVDDDDASSTTEMADSPMRLDEKLAREGSRNLRKAFSVNDRFRFRRELFGNSDIEMSDTLNLVEAMTTYPEAVDYFMTDLQWDAENPEVKDFMAIIEKHFATR